MRANWEMEVHLAENDAVSAIRAERQFSGLPSRQSLQVFVVAEYLEVNPMWLAVDVTA